MFPTPIQKAPPAWGVVYRLALPVALVIWLLPLLAVALTSVRSLGDISAGNYWGWPTEIEFLANYTAIFTQSPIGQFMLNSLFVTIPTVIGAIGLSLLTGFALAIYRFNGEYARVLYVRRPATSCRSRF